MTRNTDRIIEVGRYPQNDDYPLLEPRWWSVLTLESHSDADQEQGVTISFHHTFDTEAQARSWAERLDNMLLYGAIKLSRTYQL